jgi:Nucleotidyl transferase AbiEii toxin, Type IV TA system
MLRIEDIKRLVITSLVSDEELMETLVLKGGNAIEILQKRHFIALSRASYDIDFSMEDNFDDKIEEISIRVKNAISKTFEENGLTIFDYKFAVKPMVLKEELKDFWGGYNIEFKITSTENFISEKGNPERLRRTAIAVLPNHSPKIEIEISKHEYVEGKIETDVDGYRIYLYSPEMIAFEKVRAICQQLPEYSAIVPSHSPRPRARDFYDIFLMITQHAIDPSTDQHKQLIKNIFEAKHVPIHFIRSMHENLALHRQDWQNVLDTIPATHQVETFDFYVEFVLNSFQPLTFD